MSALVQSQVAKGPIRLLIADDDEAVRDELAAYLSEDGFEIVRTVADGIQAFEQTARLKPDVVLMDLRMPGMDGVAALGVIKARAPQIPIVVLTAFAHRDNRWAAETSGAAGFLDKDTPLPVIAEMLRAAATGSL